MSNGQCTGKARYTSPQEAHRQLARRTKRRSKRQTYNKAHVYRCPDCAGYHIGHRESW